MFREMETKVWRLEKMIVAAFVVDDADVVVVVDADGDDENSSLMACSLMSAGQWKNDIISNMHRGSFVVGK